VQFTLNPLCIEYYIMKITSGLSHSSSFVSKATGYPLAYVTAKIALGISLVTLKNKMTNQTCACFEPSLDYVTIKVPKVEIKNFIRRSDGTEISSK
jgi:carbamoylphosphate synthase large subunit